MTEWWSDGFKTQYSNIPILLHSILSRASLWIFLSSLQEDFFTNLLSVFRLEKRQMVISRTGKWAQAVSVSSPR